jgi:hypothetical protein
MVYFKNSYFASYIALLRSLGFPFSIAYCNYDLNPDEVVKTLDWIWVYI